jgi:hypothetical protein
MTMTVQLPAYEQFAQPFMVFALWRLLWLFRALKMLFCQDIFLNYVWNRAVHFRLVCIINTHTLYVFNAFSRAPRLLVIFVWRIYQVTNYVPGIHPPRKVTHTFALYFYRYFGVLTIYYFVLQSSMVWIWKLWLKYYKHWKQPRRQNYSTIIRAWNFFNKFEHMLLYVHLFILR